MFIRLNKFEGKSAFTLVELLVTISIIVILSALAINSYRGVQARGRDARRKNDLSNISISLTSYYAAQIPLKFPSHCASGSCSAGGSTTPNANPANTNTPLIISGSGDALTTALVPNFLREMPIDVKQGEQILNPPSGTPIYTYTYRAETVINGVSDQDFYMTATLENRDDTAGFISGSWAPYGFVVRNH